MKKQKASIKSAFKSWITILGLLFSVITGFRLYSHLVKVGVAEFFRPVIDFYISNIGIHFNGFINWFFSSIDFRLTLVQTDFILLYLMFCTMIFRPLAPVIKSQLDSFFLVIRFFFEKQSLKAILMSSLWALFLSLYVIVLGLLNFIIAPYHAFIHFKTPHIQSVMAGSMSIEPDPVYGFFKTYDESRGGDYLGDYRFILLFQFIGFTAALISLIVANIIIKEYGG